MGDENILRTDRNNEVIDENAVTLELEQPQQPTKQLQTPSFLNDCPQQSDYKGKPAFLLVENHQEVFYRGAYLTKVPLTGNPVIIGRRDVMAGYYPDIDLAAYWKQDRTISRRHLKIYADVNGFYYVEDLCNNDSTHVNTMDCELNRSRMVLHPGDRIFVGKMVSFSFNVVN